MKTPRGDLHGWRLGAWFASVITALAGLVLVLLLWSGVVKGEWMIVPLFVVGTAIFSLVAHESRSARTGS